MIREVIDRIQERVPELARRVEGAADFSSLMQRNALPQHTPAAHVVLLGSRAGNPVDATGLHLQMVTRTIGVILTFRGFDRIGDAALDPVEQLTGRVIAAIAGWTPDPDTVGVFSLVRDGLVSMTAGVVVHQIEFSIQTQLRIST